MLALINLHLAASNGLAGREYWPHQPSTGARTAQVDQKAYLNIFDPRFGRDRQECANF